MAPRNHERENAVRVLRKIAGDYGTHKAEPNASKEKIKAMYDQIVAVTTLKGTDKTTAAAALAQYEASFATDKPAPQKQAKQQASKEAAADDGTEPPQKTKNEWKFSAVQGTYNNEGWLLSDTQALQRLWERFLVFLQALATALGGAKGSSGTMEVSLKSAEHVHLHFYMHLSKSFHRQGPHALEDFVFEGVRPHLEANTASGRNFMGAVRFGHYYVVCPKRGSMRTWTDYPPFDKYGVEGWWIDNLIKQGKFDLESYLDEASKVAWPCKRRLLRCCLKPFVFGFQNAL